MPKLVPLKMAPPPVGRATPPGEPPPVFGGCELTWEDEDFGPMEDDYDSMGADPKLPSSELGEPGQTSGTPFSAPDRLSQVLEAGSVE
jgi:hypothetical protein